MNTLVCEHPRVIMHPCFDKMLAKYKQWYANGNHGHCTANAVHNERFMASFRPRKIGVTKDNIDSFFFLDTETGEVLPMYLLVECGKCDCCKKRRVNADVFRLRLEAECYDFQPWFFTLTYDEIHRHKPGFKVVIDDKRTVIRTYGVIPNSTPVDFVPVGGVNIRDCQLFFKRLRINLLRHGYNNKIRYFLVSEYSPGHNSEHLKRPHYHAIIFGLDCRTAAQYFEVESIIHDSWQNGFIMCRRIDMSQKDQFTFYYTTKYLRKSIGQDIPYGCCKNFVLSSKGNGGIGSKFIDSHVSKHLKSTCDTSFKFRSKWTGEFVSLRYTGYILNRVFPSFCRKVSSSFRSSVQELSYLTYQIFKFKPLSYAVKKFDNLFKRFSKYFYIFHYKDFKDKVCFSQSFRGRLFPSFYSVVRRWCEVYRQVRSCPEFSGRFLSLAQKAQALREKMFGRLFSKSIVPDMTMAKFEASKFFNYKPLITNYYG